ncbi:hypothetical protein L3Q82_001517 [Scortum barcoo]|uniref:Uncharacterized protein n=1 Tax=Scortum barcoo TaxID=214431 RepID=A0ACB8W8C5_9TELE|nr:hypothetical protein L3Q82_001517 [Scortum barcoo]
MPPGRLPREVFQACPTGEKAPWKTQDTLERLCLSAGLGTPWDPPGRAGGSVWASSLSVMSSTAEEGPVAQLAHTAHRREKRCSCENQKDKECIFFCHIGIVWVNTPSHVVPYGFGSVRLRRDLGRCLCTDGQDAECLSFCSINNDLTVLLLLLLQKKNTVTESWTRSGGSSRVSPGSSNLQRPVRRRSVSVEGAGTLRSAGSTFLRRSSSVCFEGIAKAGNPTLLNQIYTELYITEGGTAEVNDEHEVRQIETASRKADRAETTIRQEDIIFKASPGRDEPITRVMTKGVAGIGKTVLTQKFTLDWAEDKANQDIHFTFPFTFRELNVLKEKKFSLVELVHQFFTETKEAGICRFEEFQVVFIFDGLDECRLPLDFHNNEILTDVTESTSVDVLLTNLIRGKLLPSARLWITTRPAAANQIPPECVDMVTEVRGFTDPQKEEYFRKRFRDEEQASRIISHIKTSQSLHIMCHIPVFCWITATVLEDVLKTREREESCPRP